jgi:hypothetical protein
LIYGKLIAFVFVTAHGRSIHCQCQALYLHLSGHLTDDARLVLHGDMIIAFVGVLPSWQTSFEFEGLFRNRSDIPLCERLRE